MSIFCLRVGVLDLGSLRGQHGKTSKIAHRAIIGAVPNRAPKAGLRRADHDIPRRSCKELNFYVFAFDFNPHGVSPGRLGVSDLPLFIGLAPKDVKFYLDVSIDFLYGGDMNRAYLSNISPVWLFERQEALLRAALPSYPSDVQVFRDEVDALTRKARNAKALTQRAEMLWPKSRPRDETIHVASLAVLAWTQDDMMLTLTLALARGASVRALDVDLTITASSGPNVLHAAAEAFAKGKAARAAYFGGSISGPRKEAKAKAKAERIRDIYGLPIDAMPWAELLRISGLTRNTIIKHLGPRKPHQVDWLANQKRAAARTKRKDLRR